jgi:site-specific DNA-cytosine methylase
MTCLAIVEAHLPSRALALARLEDEKHRPLACESVFEEELMLLNANEVELVLVGPAPRPSGEEPDPLTVDLVQLVEHLRPLLVCVEVVPDGGRLGSSETANELLRLMEKIGYGNCAPHTGRGVESGLPYELINTAELGCQQQKNRALLLFEPVNLKGATGPLPELRPSSGRDQTLGDALRPLAEVPEASYLSGRYVPYEKPESDHATYPLLAGHLYTKEAAVGVGVGSEVTLTEEAKEAGGRRSEYGGLWRVVATQGDRKLEVVRKKGGDHTGNQHRIVRRDQVATHHVRRLEVWHPRGVGTALRATWKSTGAGPPLVLETRGSEPRARRLSVVELWLLTGLPIQELRRFERLLAEGARQVNKDGDLEALVAAGRATPTVLAELMVARAAERLHLMQKRLCLLPSVVDGEGPQVYERAARLGGDQEGLVQREDGGVEQRPAEEIQPYCAQKVGAIVGCDEGGRPTTRASGGKRVGIGGRPMVGFGPGSGRQLIQAAAHLVANSVNESTITTYESAWRNHWRVWRAMRGLPLYLDGRDPRADEEELILFVAHKAMVALYAHGTIHVMLCAIRRKHLLIRLPDPLEDSVLLKSAMKGVWRLQGGPLRKIPCSMNMLHKLADRLDWEKWDDFLILLTAVFMFLFLLRAGEATRKGPGPVEKTCIRVRSCVFLRQSVEVVGEEVQHADEVVLLMGASKTDPNGQGSVSNHYESPGSRLCILALLKKAHRMRPEHFARPENFLFTASDGKVVHRDVVAKHLAEAAVALGAPPGAASVISLRSGGASALWDAGATAEEIKRRGRWSSDCYQIYIWPGHERPRGVAAKMLGSSLSLMAPLATHRRQEK